MYFKINSEPFRRAVELAAYITSGKAKMDELYRWTESVTIKASKKRLTIYGFGDFVTVKIDLHPKEDGYVCNKAGTSTVNAHELADVMQSFTHPEPMCIYSEQGDVNVIREYNPEAIKTIRADECVTDYPGLPSRYDQVVKVHLPHFIKGIQQVRYAMAKDPKLYYYQCIFFEVRDSALRFTAGSGNRFAVYSIADSNPISAKPDTIEIMIPKLIINNFLRVFRKVDSPTLQVKYAQKDWENDTDPQIVFAAGNVVLAFLKLKHYCDYPDVDPILKACYPYQISTCAEDWRRVGKAIKKTYTGPDDSIPITKMTANIRHGYFRLESTRDESFDERIDFVLGQYVADSSNEENHQPYVKCESKFLEEIAQKGYKDGNVSVRFKDLSHYDSFPDGKPKKVTPILFSYPPRENKDKTTEKLDIFMATSSEW